MIVIKPEVVEVKTPHTLTIALLSDLHIGNAFVDEKNLKKDLDRAKELGCPIGINGDVFDAILPSDKKRYNPTALHPRLQNRADVCNAALDYACELLAPVASQIHFIGVGNHETAVEKHHAQDLSAQLVTILNKECKTQIQYGGYTGWWVHRFARQQERWSYVINYHHGSGGGAEVTKGLIKFARRSAWTEGADCLWLGHLHHKTADRDVVQTLDLHHRIKHVERLRVMSASYIDTYREQTSQDALEKGRNASYGSDAGYAPQSHGGIYLHLSFVAGKPIRAVAEV